MREDTFSFFGNVLCDIRRCRRFAPDKMDRKKRKNVFFFFCFFFSFTDAHLRLRDEDLSLFFCIRKEKEPGEV